MQVDLDALDRLHAANQSDKWYSAIGLAYPAIAAELREARQEIRRLQQAYAASVQEVAAKSRELYDTGRRISNQRKHLTELENRVRDLRAEIDVRDNSANETLRILREALPNRGFHSEMEAAEAAAKEIEQLRNGRMVHMQALANIYWKAMSIGLDRGNQDIADIAGDALKGNTSPPAALDDLRRRERSIGAEEELRRIADLIETEALDERFAALFCADLLDRADAIAAERDHIADAGKKVNHPGIPESSGGEK